MLVHVLSLIAFIWSQPFEPKLQTFDLNRRSSKNAYYTEAKHLQLTVANVDEVPVWVPNRKTSFLEKGINGTLAPVKLNLVVVDFGHDGAIRLSPGEGVVYDLFVLDTREELELSVAVRDRWLRPYYYTERLKLP